MCVSLSNFVINRVRGDGFPLSQWKPSLLHTPQPWFQHSTPPHTGVGGPPAAAQARALIVDRSLRLRVPQLLYRATLRTDVYVTSARASRSTPIGSHSEWSLSHGPFVRSLSSPAYATFFQRRLPGSQVLRSWLCLLQWFLIENRHNLPIVGTETPGLFHGPGHPLPFAISRTSSDPRGSLLWAPAPQAQPQVSPRSPR